MVFLNFMVSNMWNRSSSNGISSSIGGGHLRDFRSNWLLFLSVEGFKKKYAFRLMRLIRLSPRSQNTSGN